MRSALAAISGEAVIAPSDYLRFGVDPAPLGRDRTYALSLRHFFALAPPAEGAMGPRVRTVGYSYALYDRDGQELITYQWHPVGPSPVIWPHLHLGGRLLRPELPRSFGQTHWPTERVTLTAVLRAVIADLGFEPLQDDWEARLTAADGVLRASLG